MCVEEMHYYFSGSSIKFLGQTGWKIDDLNPIWVRLLSRSQLSNPSDLPCYITWMSFGIPNISMQNEIWYIDSCDSTPNVYFIKNYPINILGSLDFGLLRRLNVYVLMN